MNQLNVLHEMSKFSHSNDCLFDVCCAQLSTKFGPFITKHQVLKEIVDQYSMKCLAAIVRSLLEGPINFCSVLLISHVRTDSHQTSLSNIKGRLGLAMDSKCSAEHKMVIDHTSIQTFCGYIDNVVNYLPRHFSTIEELRAD